MADPNDLIYLRDLLKSHNIITAEYSGGKYSADPIREADMTIFITHPQPIKDNRLFIGKGVHTEAIVSLQSGNISIVYKDKKYFTFKLGLHDTNDYKEKYAVFILEDVVDINDLLNKSTKKGIDFPIGESMDDFFNSGGV